MVKNRNWQNRVENAEARRTAAKARKQKRDNKGANKAMVQELVVCLDRHWNALQQTSAERQRYDIHIWTDSIPSDSPELLDLYDEPLGMGRRNRSGSMGSESSKRRGRTRSNSLNESQSSAKKKVHPRSKEGAPEPDLHELETTPTLCRDQFFFGQCEGDAGGKKGTGCRFVHYLQHQNTLGKILKFKREDIFAAHQASGSDSTLSDTRDMEMVYYFSIPLSQNLSLDVDQEGAESSVNDFLADALSKRDCSLGSIVYVCVGDVLVFDRYREGLLVSDEDIERNLIGQEFRRLRSSSIISDNDDEAATLKIESDIVLPGPVLEYVLKFLPDEAVRSMCLVCNSWFAEIGRNSPDLWRYMLARRDWSLPESAGEEALDETARISASRDLFRKSFIIHYTVVRDIMAICTAANDITLSTKKTLEERDMVFQLFSHRRFAPQVPNGCIAVEVWSPCRVLAAYSHDSTIRLFKAIGKSAESGNPRACRELVCVSFDPYKNTKKRTCRLVAMGLDDDMIGSLCHVMAESDEHEAYILTVMSRNDFLCSAAGSASTDPGGSSVEDGQIVVIDIGLSVVNYILSSDEVDHRLLRLFDFIADGGGLSDVEILVSQSLLACGRGRFMVEATIAIPSLHFDNDEVDATMVLLDRKLFLFSATVGAIIWMGDSHPSETMLPRYEEVTMTCRRRSFPGERRTTCDIAVVSASSPVIVSAEIDPSGQVTRSQSVIAAELVRDELLQGNWEFQEKHHRPVVISGTDIVALDSFYQETDNNQVTWKSVVSFYPRYLPEAPHAILTLKGDCEAVRMEWIREEHVVVLCRIRRPVGSGTDDGPDEEEADGSSEANQPIKVYAVVVHVPSRREIHRTCLLDDSTAHDFTASYDIPIFLSSSAQTVAAGLWWKGIVMTGEDVRAVGARETPSASEERNAKKSKKKSGKGAKKQRKKDGFARGMSLRG